MDLELTNHQMCDAFTSVRTNKESNPVLERFTKYAYISDSENDNLSHLIFSTCSKATKNVFVSAVNTVVTSVVPLISHVSNILQKIFINNCFCMCSLK